MLKWVIIECLRPTLDGGSNLEPIWIDLKQIESLSWTIIIIPWSLGLILSFPPIRMLEFIGP